MANPIAQGRMIRKSISDSDAFASLSPESMILFCMLIPHFNAHGKRLGNPYIVKGEIVPKITWFTLEKIEDCLKEISEKTSVKWFAGPNGVMYLHSTNDNEHQQFKNDRRGADNLPSYSGEVNNKSRTTTTLLSDYSPASLGIKGKVKGKEKEGLLNSNLGPPTIRDVKMEAQRIGFTGNPDKFFMTYEAVGWKVNNQPITNWRALLGKWKIEETSFNVKNGNGRKVALPSAREALGE